MNTNADTPIIPGYQLRELLYTGSKTRVYRAIQQIDQLPVVIKILISEYPSFNELLQFRNQYTISKNLNIPGIIQPLSLETYGNGYILVMADQEEISLREYIKTTTLPLGEFLAIALQLTNILHHLHQKRVIHKDIKPANILINPQTKEVQLIDFSIASLLPKETQEIKNPHVLEGTLAYISPEQTGRMNRGIDYRSDFYSLGVTFYELLTGELPFICDAPMELVHCHLAQLASYVSDIKPEIPEVISKIINKLLAKNAEDRYQSALGLQHDFETCSSQLKDTGKITDFEIGQRDVCDRFLIPEKLYGREADVQRLLDAFERVTNGTSEIMLVAGFSGIGKTAVVNEVHKPITRKNGYFIKGKFDQFNRNIPFSAFVQSFRNLMGQLLSESDTQLQTWKTQILAALGENAQVIIEVIPELERIIGEQPPAPELSSTAAQNRFNLLFQKFLQVFTTPEHPLVIFLDDLQWADLASLKLMHLLMGELQTEYLLLIGAYRDNEVSPAHQLMLTLNEVSKAGATLNSITLQPLSVPSLNQLVADTLNCAIELAQTLTKLVYQKTQGNPFFATQFLKALYQKQLITFDTQAGYWQCDITSVRDAALTDDVVELMAQQLQRLPVETQAVLKLAACIGNQFDLSTLAIVSQQSPKEVATTLWQALQEGLILPQSDLYKFYWEETPATQHTPQETLNYRFLHDRVQQAAYSLIPEAQKQTTHLKIGRLLLKNTNVETLETNIFDIANHWNQALDLILVNESEKMELVHLNILAGRKAKNSIAYKSALGYLKIAIVLLPSDIWNDQYNLALDLYNLAGETAYLSGDYVLMEQWLSVLLAQTTNVLDQISAYQTKIQAHTSQTQQQEVIHLALQVLEILGVQCSEKPDEKEVEQAFTALQNKLKYHTIEALSQLPRMTDKKWLAVIQMLQAAIPTVYQVNAALFQMMVFKLIDLSLEYGNTSFSAFGYACYGLLLCGRNQVEMGHQFGCLSSVLAEKFGDRGIQVKTLFCVNVFINVWKQNINDVVASLQQVYQLGIEQGEIEFSGYAIFHYSACSYLSGTSLNSLKPQITDCLEILKNLKQNSVVNWTQCYLESILILLQESSANILNPQCDFAKILDGLNQKQDFHGLFHAYLNQGILFYLMGCISQSRDALECAEKYLDTVTGSISIVAFTFYDFLVRVTSDCNADITDQSAILEILINNKSKIQEWAIHAPNNYQHKYCLLEAEYCRILSRYYQAMECYDRAISGAKANGYIQEEALANELAAKFYLDWGKEKIAAVYMQEAYYCYSRWGAKAKVAHLETSYPDLLRPILPQTEASTSILSTLATISPLTISAHTRTRKGSSSTNINHFLDFATILKTSQALSSTIQFDELLHQLTQIILQNSAADRCALMLLNETGEWQVRAIATPDETKLCAEPLTNNPNIPVKLIQYVKNTQEIVVIDELKTDLPVIDDYLRQQQPKSVLCMPLLHQGHLISILYLKNRLTCGVFTEERILILNFLCTQAAISLENARLHAQEQEKSNRLEESQKRLQLIIQQAPIAVIEWNTEFEFQVWNPSAEKMFGYSAAEVLGKHFRCIIPKEYHAYVDTVGRAILAERGGSHAINENLTKDGKRIICEWFNAPMLNLNGEVCGGVSMVLDISDRQRAEAAIQKKSQELETALQELKQAQLQMVQSEKMASLGNLVAGVAHEVNNPIAFLNGSIKNAKEYIQDLMEHIELYQQHYPQPVSAIQENAQDIDLAFLMADLPKLLDAMIGANNRIKSISNSLRTFSRADTDYKVTANLHEGLDSTLLILKYRIKANEHRPAIIIQPEYGDIPPIKCFPGQLNQVFMNILANAIDMFDEMAQTSTFAELQAHPQQITISTEAIANQVYIKIRDNGKGISAEVQGKIFDHLFTTKGVGKGTGLGLAIARQIVEERHGGTIEVNSILEKGTEFVISIPIKT